MQERDILQDANNQMNEVSARKLQVSSQTRSQRVLPDSLNDEF